MAQYNPDSEINDESLQLLEQAGVLSGKAKQTVNLWRLTKESLARDAGRLLLVIGASLAVAGAIIYFALNWEDMGAFVQLALPQLLIAACLLVVFRRGLARLEGQIGLLAAAVFVGAWLAIFGVVFKTGKDVFFLFLTWAALISPWILAGRFAPLWLLWLGILDAALGRFFCLDEYWHRFLWWNKIAPFAWLSLALLNGLALYIREKAIMKGIVWLAEAQVRYVVLLSVLWFFSSATFITFFDSDFLWLTVLVQAAALIFLIRTYRRRLPDFMAVALVMLDGCIMSVALFIRGIVFLFDHWSWHDQIAGIVCLGVAGLFTVSVFAWSTFWLKRINAEMREARERKRE